MVHFAAEQVVHFVAESVVHFHPEWVVHFHRNTHLVYQGYVWGYSDGGDERELLMTQVIVFAKSGESEELVMVDTIPVLYLGLDRKNTVLEFRAV